MLTNPTKYRNVFPTGSSIAPGNSPLQGRLHAFSPEDSAPMIEGRSAPSNVFAPNSVSAKALAGPTALMSFAPAVPTIASMAAALGNDIDAIYRYVANQIEFLATYGSQKGALSVMLDKVGNSYDQAALMVALLQASGKTANFLFGQLKLTAAQAGSWLGTDPTNIWASRNLLGNGGIPVDVIWDAPSSTYYLTLSHVWVKVDVTGSGGWYVFDPAFKSHTITAGIDLPTIMGYNATTFQTAVLTGSTSTADYYQNINTANLSSQVDTFNTNVLNWIAANKPDATVNDLLGGKTINQITGVVRNTILSYQDASVTPTVWTSIPATYKTTLRVQFDSIDQTFYSEDISSKRLTLFFNGSLQAELRLDGTLLATSGAQGVGTWNSALLTITHPYANTWANQSFYQTVWAGDYYLIAQSWGNSSQDMAYLHQKLQNDNRLAGLADTSDAVLGESLSVLWHNWSAQKTIMCNMIGRMNKCSTVLHHQIGMVGHGQAPFTDLGGIVWSTSATDNDYTRVPNTDTVIALRGIGFESNTINQVPGITAASSNDIISKANTDGQKLYFASSANWATVRPLLTNYTTAELDNLTSWYINNNWKLLIHENGATNKESYTGYGIYGISPNGGCVGLINGFLHGGTASVAQTPAANNAASSLNQAVPDNLDRVEVGKKTEAAIDFNTDHYTGFTTYRHTDMAVSGAPYPIGLPFTRLYNNKDSTTVTEVGRAWRHNYMISAELSVHSYTSLGGGSGAAAAGNVVYGMLAILLVPGVNNNMAFLISSISTTDASALLTNNVVVVRDGDRSYTFAKLKDGTYTSPKGVSLALGKTIDRFVMQSFDGVRYTFTNWALNKTRVETIEWPSNGGTALVMTFTYGGVGPDYYLSSVSNNHNNTLNFGYTLFGGLIPYLSSVSGGGHSCTYAFDVVGTGHLTSFRDAMALETTYAYDTKHRLTGYTRPNGVGYSVIYDDQDRVISQINPVYTLSFTFAKIFATTNGGPEGFVNTSFNDDGQPTTIYASGEYTSLNYDGLGRLFQKTLPRGDTTTFYYDQWNRVTTQIHTPGTGGGITQSQSFSYAGIGTNSWDKWTSHTDERGLVWSRTYDSAGNLTSETAPAVAGGTPVRSWTYGSFSLVATETDATGIVTTYGYTANGELQTVVQDSGRLNLNSSAGYDAAGNKVSVTNARGFTKTMAYDNNRRLTQITETAPFGFTTNFTYDTVGNMLTTSRQSSGAPQTTSSTYSSTNRLLTHTDPLGRVTTDVFDVLDRHASTTDAAGRQRQYVYDGNGKLWKIVDASGVVEEYRLYNSGGDLASISDARSNTSTFARDGFGRVLQLVYPNASYEAMTYDVSGNVLTHRMRSAGIITNTFDNLSRLITKSPASQPVITNSYDKAGRLLSTSKPVVSGDPSSGVFSRGYDTAGRLISETNPQSQVMGYQLDGNGNLTKTTYPSGYYASKVYDQLDRLTDIKLNGAATSAVVFGYDPLSRRTSKNNGNSANTGYSYDLGNNLLTMNITFVGSSANWTYTYNQVHQMLTQNCSDASLIWRPTAGTITYATANSVNQYGTIGGLAATYNSLGALATYNGWTYSYNTEQMLIAASKTGTSASFVYDPLMRQTQKTVGSVKKKYVYGGSQMMEEYNGTTNALTTRYVYAGPDEPVLQMTAAGVVTYIDHDHHGSVIAQSGSTGAVGNKYKYGPFGESATLTGTTFGYTGQRFDSETGLYHYKARYFLPSIGRFLQPDPVGYGAGMNLYAYCSNDGLNHTDPDGLEEDFSIHGPLGVFGPGVKYVAQDRNNGVVATDMILHVAGGPVAKGAGAGLKAGGRYLLQGEFPKRAYVAAAGHARNAYGRLVEYAGDKKMLARGWEILGKNLSTTAGGKNGQFDRLYKRLGEKLLKDWKGGTSKGSRGQLEAKAAGPAGTTARGANSAAAGLPAGQTLESQGVTGISIEKMKLKY